MTNAELIGAMGVAVCAISAWLCIKGRDGSGWAIVAVFLIVTSCNQAK